MKAIIDGDVFNHWSARATETPEEAEEKLHELMEDAIASSFADEYVVAVKGKGNYRKEIFSEYKGNRKPLDADLKERIVRTHKVLISEYDAKMAHDQEADDLVRIWAEEARNDGKDFVVVAEDKDLNCIPGPHYNPKKGIHFYVTEEEALLLFHQQLLTGDSADNIKGLWKVGPKTAQKILAEVESKDYMKAVIDTWKERRPDDWQEGLDMCGKLIYIRQQPDEIWSLEEYL